MKRGLLAALIILTFAGLGAAVLARSQAQPPGAETRKPQARITNDRNSRTTPATQPATFDKSAHSINEAASLWLVVNKLRPLHPAAYVPDQLTVPDVALRSNISGDERQIRGDAAAALKQLFDAARRDGITLNLQSGYRSHAFQSSLYARYVRQQGQTTADTQSARPGYSEHQTGLAADVGGVTRPSCNVQACFAETDEGKWLAAHAHEYGFVIRYPADTAAVTGYMYEPWHLRYVGTELANEMKQQGISTLEEFFGLPPAPGYH